MKLPKFERGLPEIKPNPSEDGVEGEKKSPDTTSESPRVGGRRLERRPEKRREENTDERIEQVLSWLNNSKSRRPEFARAVEELKAAKPEREKKGTFGMFRELWSVTSNDCKAALIGEFIFNPNALKARYFEEMNYRRNMKGRWRK